MKGAYIVLLFLPTVAWAQFPPAGGRVGPQHTCRQYYPDAEQKAGIEGTTTLGMTVTADGDVRDLVVAKSSGNTNLDNAALRCASRWRYRPAMQDGKPVALTGWLANVVWKLEVLPLLAEQHPDCVRSYPVKPEDLAGIDGTTEVTFEIVRGEVRGASVTHPSGNAALDRAAVECISNRKYMREMVMVNGMMVDRYRSMTFRERITWADALKPAPASTNALTTETVTPIDRHPCKAGSRWNLLRYTPVGATVMSYKIEPDGSVRDIEVSQSSGDETLDKTAIACATSWRYKPPTKDGKPVEVDWTATVHWTYPLH